MSDLRLEDVYPTGEYRAPRKGELYVNIFRPLPGRQIIQANQDEAERYQRIIVKEHRPPEDLEQTEELDEEILEDACEAAVLRLTKILLDDNEHSVTHLSAARTVLEHLAKDA